MAPHWGRLNEQIVKSGVEVEPGELLGHLRERGLDTPLVAPLQAVFIGWLVTDRQRVAPGTPLALLRRIDGQS
ncbi:MAG: hypothetical protein ACRDGU_02085 [Actinomycetota bacterium]